MSRDHQNISNKIPLVVTQPQPHDAKEIENLYRLVIKDTFSKHGLHQSHPDEIEDEVSEKMGSLEHELHLVTKVDGVIVGIIGIGKVNEEIRKNYPATILANDVEVKNVYVLPSYQSKGVGSRLFAEVIKELRKRGIEYFYLDSGFKLAQSYWQHKLGEPTVVKESYFGKGEHYMIWKSEVAKLGLK